jgi:predicted  nucleic acid-binding Zn-ribbon protein
MITIDDIEYAEEDLTEESKIRIKRIQELRAQIDSLMINYEELQAAISHHAGKIKESVDAPEGENGG